MWLQQWAAFRQPWLQWSEASVSHATGALGLLGDFQGGFNVQKLKRSWYQLISWSYDAGSDQEPQDMTKPRENKFVKRSEAEWIQPPHQEKEASPNKAWRGHKFQLFTLTHQRLLVEQWRKTLVDWLCVDIYRGLYNLVYWDFVGPIKSTMDNKPGCITNWIFTISIYIYISIGPIPLLLSQEPDKIPDSLQATVEVLQRPRVPTGMNPRDTLGAMVFPDSRIRFSCELSPKLVETWYQVWHVLSLMKFVPAPPPRAAKGPECQVYIVAAVELPPPPLLK